MQKKAVRVGDCVLDGKHIYIQSMLNTRSDDIAGTGKSIGAGRL